MLLWVLHELCATSRTSSAAKIRAGQIHLRGQLRKGAPGAPTGQGAAAGNHPMIRTPTLSDVFPLKKTWRAGSISTNYWEIITNNREILRWFMMGEPGGRTGGLATWGGHSEVSGWDPNSWTSCLIWTDTVRGPWPADHVRPRPIGVSSQSKRISSPPSIFLFEGGSNRKKRWEYSVSS